MKVNHVAVIDKSGLLNDRITQLIAEAYRGPDLERFCESWGLPIPGIAVYTADHDQKIEEEAAIIFVDSGNQPGAFGWHTALGVSVFGYVDVGMCRRFGEPPDRVFGHEFWELLLDPPASLWQLGPGGTWYAKEACDPVQRFSRTTRVQHDVLGSEYVEIADYILPAWFDGGNLRGPWSEQGHAPGPFLDAEGGYHVEARNGVALATGGRPRNYGRTHQRLQAAPS